MGVPTKPTVPYRDDPDAVSLHTTPGESSDFAPPTYADATVEGPVSGIPGVGVNLPTPRRLPSGTPTGINEELRRGTAMQKTSKVIGKSSKCIDEVNNLQERNTDNSPDALEQVIREMARHAPTPYIQIIGTHTERRRDRDGKGSKSEQITDFRILVNMRNYLWPNFDVHATNSVELRTVENGEKTYRGTLLKTRAPGYNAELEVGDARPDLKEWCHRYCASATNNRMCVFASYSLCTTFADAFLQLSFHTYSHEHGHSASQRPSRRHNQKQQLSRQNRDCFPYR